MFITQPEIFIRSTIVDLPNVRKAALKAVENAGDFPVMSEFTVEAQSTDSLKMNWVNRQFDTNIQSPLAVLDGLKNYVVYGFKPAA
jgi:hypothetical protein